MGLFKMDCIFWNKAENIRLKSKGSLIDTATQSRCQLLSKVKFMVGISLCVMLGLILSVAKSTLLTQITGRERMLQTLRCNMP